MISYLVQIQLSFLSGISSFHFILYIFFAENMIIFNSTIDTSKGWKMMLELKEKFFHPVWEMEL